MFEMMQSDRTIELKEKKNEMKLSVDLQNAEIGEALQIRGQETGQVVPLQISVSEKNKNKETNEVNVKQPR